MKKIVAIICGVLMLCTATGVYATWHLIGGSVPTKEENIHAWLGEFVYTPEDMPSGEVSVVQRLSDILNQKYKTDTITDSRDYLINKTIQVYWGGNIYADPYVGSMDKNFEKQIDELFHDVLIDENVSFILKTQDLNGDGYKEIAMYSTSDPVDCLWEFEGVLCVYVTVFTPKIDENKNIIGYHLVCESLRGYCYEVYYGQGDTTPSFSTDEWRDDIGYYHYFDEQSYRIPEDAMSLDGTKPLRHDYASYNTSYQYEPGLWGSTLPYGKRLWEYLWDKIPYLS